MTPDNLRYDLEIIASWIEPGSKVLGLGCGEGDLLFWLKKEKNVKERGIEIEESKDYKIHDIDALRKLQEYKDFISTTNITANHPLFKSFIKSRFTKSSSYEIINK